MLNNHLIISFQTRTNVILSRTDLVINMKYVNMGRYILNFNSLNNHKTLLQNFCESHRVTKTQNYFTIVKFHK